MADFETRVRVTAQPKGFDKVQQEAAKLKGAQQQTTQGFQSATKAVATFQTTVEKAMRAFSARGAKREVQGLNEIIEELQDHLSTAAERQLELQAAMLSTEKGSEAYRKIADEMKRLDGEAAQVNKTLGLVERAFRQQIQVAREAADTARQAGGAFRQGFAQGAGLGEFIQRGPGMGRQMLGRAAGGALVGAPMGLARGIAATPFQGLQGLAGGIQQAAQTLPYLGAPAALSVLPMMQAASMAGPAVGFQRQRMEAAPLLRGAFGFEQRGAAARQDRLAAQGLTAADIEKRAQEAGAAAAARIAIPTGRGSELAETNMAMAMAFLPERARRTAQTRAPGEIGAVRDVAAERETARAAAVAAERERLQGEAVGVGGARGFRQIGQRFGMALPEVTELATAISQAGGGVGAELLGPGGFMDAAAAARRMGIGGEISGAFLGAQRRGGIAGMRPGTPGGGADQLISAFAQAQEMGLEGSEVPEYLSVIAEGIQNWRQTGIPVAKDAIAGIGLAMTGRGVAGVRGTAIAQGLVGAAQQLSRGGPTGAAQLMMLQTMGGFRGGGAAGLEEAQIQLEELQGGNIGEKGIEFIQRLVQGFGGGAGGRAGARAELAGLGIQFGAREFRDLLESPGGMAPGRAGPGLLEQAEATKRYASSIDETVRVQNEQLKIGERMIPTLKHLDSAMANLAAGFEDLAGDKLKKFTAVVEELTKAAAGKKSIGAAITEALGISTQ